MHDPECIEPDCSNHGSCDLGVCSCDPPWIGEGCGRLNCSLSNCSSHGVCNSDKGEESSHVEPNVHVTVCDEQLLCFQVLVSALLVGMVTNVNRVSLCTCSPVLAPPPPPPPPECDQDHYGEGCKQRCWCAWNQLCHAERGCVCKPGYSGNYWCSGKLLYCMYMCILE